MTLRPAQAGNVRVADSITVLTTKGPILTKRWLGNGTIQGHDRAKQHTVTRHAIESIHDLAAVLDPLRKQPKSCVIRGDFIGNEAAILVPDPNGEREKGFVLRQAAYFSDPAHHYAMFDVDGYEPLFADPDTEPEQAIEEWIAANLPAEYQGISYYWQLSSSAGHPSKKGTLRCHLWFWLSRAMTSPEAQAYVTLLGLPVDRAVFNVVQAHYTADPVMSGGIVDPLPSRGGLVEGLFGDVVNVQIDEGALAVAMVKSRSHTPGEIDPDVVDPRTKKGVVGAFCRAFSPEDVLMADWFTGNFERVSDRRYTWIDGNGAAEGAYLTDDGLKFVNTHNTAPQDTIRQGLNAYDLTRVYNFGHLDDAVPEEDRAFWDIDPRSRPSDKAMHTWARGLDEVRAELKEEAESREVEREIARVEPLPVELADEKYGLIDELKGLINAAPDERSLREEVCKRIAVSAIEQLDRAAMASMVQARLKDLSGARVPIGQVRELLRPPRTEAEGGMPAWADGWVWSKSDDKFFHLDRKQMISKTSFDACYSRHLTTVNQNGETVRIKASDIALDVLGLDTVDGIRYLPGFMNTFTMDNRTYANAYRSDMIPDVPARQTEADQAAVAAINRHLKLLVPNAEYRETLIKTLAWIARKPGQKLQYAPLIKGVEGDGKSILAQLLSVLMGQPNVKIISPETLSKSAFTGWAENNSLIVIEELRLHGANRFEIVDKLKPIITNKWIEVHPKGRDPYTAPNTSAVMAMTNHEDAIPLTDTDRRWFVIFSPWQHISEMHAAIEDRYGLTPDQYWAETWSAIDNHAGALRGWLESIDLSDFNQYARAPLTEYKTRMLDDETSELEMALGDILSAAAPGTGKDGIVLGARVAHAIESQTGAKPQGRRLNKMLASLGYLPHPKGVLKFNGKTYRVYVTAAWMNRSTVDMIDALRMHESDPEHVF